MPGTKPPAKPGTPVPPPGPTCSLNGVASFRPGVWNNVPVSAGDLRDMARTFAELRGYYDPYLSLNHDDGLSFGRVSALRVGPGGTLTVDAENVPAEVGGWVNGGRLQAPSIEFWEPGDFVMPDGRPNKVRVFKCLTLLGNRPPGVKGLGPLPAATFADRGKAKRFSGAVMDRAGMIAALTAAGMDVTTITDAVPDDVLQKMLECIQKASQPAPAVQNADPTPTPAVTPTPAATPTGAGPVTPTSLTVKFNDRHGKPRTGTPQEALDELTAGYAAMRDANAAVARTQEQLLTDAKRAKVKRFRDEMTGAAGQPAYLTPAQFDAVEPLLLAADDVAVRKFADGKASGTALDEAAARIKAAHPTPVRRFGDRLPDPERGGQGAGPALTADEKATLLKATPLGRSALAAAKK